MELDEFSLKWFIIIFMWIESLWEMFLSLRQIKVYKTSLTVPVELEAILDKDTFHKARLYGLDKANYGVVKDSVSFIFNTSFLALGWMGDLWRISEKAVEDVGLSPENEIIVSCFFMIITNILNTLIHLPFSVYNTFVLEEKHGFNKQTPLFYIKDHLKSFVLAQVLTLPLTSAAIMIVKKGGNMFILWLWLFTGVMILLIVTIYPAYIAPLFDKYSPLPDGALRESIEKLAASLKFPLGQLYVVEGSKRSAHSNAYFYGLFGSKRIVLFDTLLKDYVKEDEKKGNEDESSEGPEIKEKKKKTGCSDPEVLAVLAHELGHWQHGHIYINLIAMQINLLLMFGAFGYMFKFAPLYRALGFNIGEMPVIVGLVGVLQLVLAPYNAFLSFAMTILSRRFEFQADKFAVDLGHSDKLQKALIKLNIDNLGFPVYDPLYSAWHHSHPTLLQRLERMEKDKKE